MTDSPPLALPLAPQQTAPAPAAPSRRIPIGAEYQGAGLTHFRVWAPVAGAVAVVLSGGRRISLAAEGNGYFNETMHAGPGERYQFQIDGGERLYPDPASRYQPEGPHGASEIVDPAAFNWTDETWKGITLQGQVAYELHIGTFTPEGTFASAARQLPALARLGITLVEVMPIAEFDGRFGWGYDGVDLFAASHLYGTPDDFRRFVDTAHAHGIAVVLDVVYNHLGPSGNYLRAFAPAYFTDRYENEWGDAINFDGPDAGPVREFFTSNAAYWIDEFHLDGLRLDATQQIFDASAEHILAAIGRAARRAAGSRSIVLIAENELQETRLVHPLDAGGYGLDGLWNDDFHHAAIVALTGRNEAYYGDTKGTPQEFVSAAKYGYLFQGQFYHWQRQRRGTPSWRVPRASFVAFLENHDQVANSAHGRRLHQLTSPGRWRAMTALLLLGPATPMLFQGQEMNSSAPFLYFADLGDELADAVRKGRAEFLTQFPSIVDYEARGALDLSSDPATFARCKLDWSERERNAAAYRLHADLLRLRREDPGFAGGAAPGLDGAVLSASAFVLRFFRDDHRDDRLLIVNLGPDLNARSIAEPLLAPPRESDWVVLWSSEDPRYGGGGTPDPWPDEGWYIAGESALVLGPGSKREPRSASRRRRTA
jgi:maltooligosyltrehalose trehalohydrolase